MSKKKENLKLAGFRLPESLFTKVKHTCLDLGMSFQEFITKLINDYYNR